MTARGISHHFANLGVEPAVWRYSPKQQDFHPINLEALALRSQSEIVVGLRSPLTNRTTGDAYARDWRWSGVPNLQRRTIEAIAIGDSDTDPAGYEALGMRETAYRIYEST